MRTWLFLLTATLPLGVTAVLVRSILRPDDGPWPPRSRPRLWVALTWAVTGLTAAGTGAVGLLHWNAWGWPTTLRWGLGGGLLTAGSLLAWVTLRAIGPAATGGAPGPLVTRGAYRLSRNPQCLADLALAAGWATLSASTPSATLCALSAAAFLLFPLAEEPWLQARHGAAFSAYRRRVRRFV